SPRQCASTVTLWTLNVRPSLAWTSFSHTAHETELFRSVGIGPSRNAGSFLSPSPLGSIGGLFSAGTSAGAVPVLSPGGGSAFVLGLAILSPFRSIPAAHAAVEPGELVPILHALGQRGSVPTLTFLTCENVPVRI